MKKFLALLLAAMMLLGMTSAFAEATDTDTITVMVPPVTGTYLDDIDTWANDFMAEHPEIKVEVIKTSWDDHNSKLNTMANAGEAPDIAEVSYSAIGTYVELGLGVEIDQYMDAERLADYDQNALDYMSLDGHVYGLPLYITIQALGANKDMLEAAGVDVAKVQTEGWTYDQFMEAIKNGTWGVAESTTTAAASLKSGNGVIKATGDNAGIAMLVAVVAIAGTMGVAVRKSRDAE